MNRTFGIPLVTVLLTITSAQPVVAKKDIRELSQHFIESSGDISPWMFIPEDNIKSCSAKRNLGYVKLSEAGKGKDVKGILKDPIRIDDYPIPWEFELGILQDMVTLECTKLHDAILPRAQSMGVSVSSESDTWF